MIVTHSQKKGVKGEANATQSGRNFLAACLALLYLLGFWTEVIPFLQYLWMEKLSCGHEVPGAYDSDEKFPQYPQD